MIDRSVGFFSNSDYLIRLFEINKYYIYILINHNRKQMFKITFSLFFICIHDSLVLFTFEMRIRTKREKSKVKLYPTYSY